MSGHLIFQGWGVYQGEAGCAARCQSAGAGSVGRAVKKRVMSSAAVGDSIIAWTRADISAIGSVLVNIASSYVRIAKSGSAGLAASSPRARRRREWPD